VIRRSQAAIDAEALSRAMRAETLIEQHMSECAEQRKRQREDFVDLRAAIDGKHERVLEGINGVHTRVDELHGRWWRGMGLALMGLLTAVLGLVSLVGYLLVHGAPWAS